MARILIVDDEPLVRNLVRATLDFGEHELLEAFDAGSAVALGEASPPDLVILDLGLPGETDGAGLLRKMQRACGAARFIVLTGSGTAHEAQLRAAGACDFLTKPFSPLQLIERIERALGVNA